MGNCADDTAAEMNITRQDQDDFALASYERAQNATKQGLFKDEIVAVEVPGEKGKGVKLVTEDEDIWTVNATVVRRDVGFHPPFLFLNSLLLFHHQLNADKIRVLKPAFGANGTVTAANASPINDGASALVLVSGRKVAELGLKPIAKILGWGDAGKKKLTSC